MCFDFVPLSAFERYIFRHLTIAPIEVHPYKLFKSTLQPEHEIGAVRDAKVGGEFGVDKARVEVSRG